jgi:hypothetical protein
VPYYVRCLWGINDLHSKLTAEDKLVAATKVGIVGDHRQLDAEIDTLQALLNELNESHEKEYVEVGVDKHFCCLPFEKIDAVTAVAMAEQANINTASMRAIARFLRRVRGVPHSIKGERHACYLK